MYITSSEGRKQHSTCLALPGTDPALSRSVDMYHFQVFVLWWMLWEFQGYHRECYPDLARTSKCADGASQEGAAWTPVAPGACDRCALNFGFGTSHQPTNSSLGSHLNCRADPSQGETGSSRQSCLSEQAKTEWNQLSGVEENGKSLLAYHLLWGTLKRRTTTWTLTTLNVGSLRAFLTMTVPQMEINVQQNISTSASNTEQWWS